MMRNRSNSERGLMRQDRSLTNNEHTNSQGHLKLNNSSTTDDALQVFNSIKAELSSQITDLTKLKKEVIATDNIEVSAKSRLRITIESLLIDLNEEIFALSEELAKSFSGENSRTLVSKAREFEMRKKQIVQKVKQTIDDDPIAKIVRRDQKIRQRSISDERSRSRSQEKKRQVPLRRPIDNQSDSRWADRSHSPPQRDERPILDNQIYSS